MATVIKNDSIKTLKNGVWQRAIVHKWNGSAWVRAEVYTTDDYEHPKHNLNATEVVKVYKPTWFTRFNRLDFYNQYADMVSTNGLGIAEVGYNYAGTENYSCVFGMPYSAIMSDYNKSYGISKIIVTYDARYIGNYGFGRSPIFGVTNASYIPLNSSTSSISYSNEGDDYYVAFFSWEENDEYYWHSDGFIRILNSIGIGESKGFELAGDLYDNPNVWFKLSDLTFTVHWAYK